MKQFTTVLITLICINLGLAQIDFTPYPGNATHCPGELVRYTASGSTCGTFTWTITNGKILDANNTEVTTLTGPFVDIMWDNIASTGTLKVSSTCGGEAKFEEKNFAIRSLAGRDLGFPRALQSNSYCQVLPITLAVDVMFLLNTGGSTGITQQRADGYEWVLPTGWSGNGSSGTVRTSEEYINISPDNGCRGGTATVKAFMNCTSGRKYSNPASINIDRVGFSSNLGVPSGYSGPKCGKTDPVTFTAASLNCASTYQWSAGNTQWKDAFGNAGPWTTTTNWIDLYPRGNPTDQGVIAVNINIGCATLTQTFNAIYSDPLLSTPTFASGSTSVLCSGGGGTVSINSVNEAATYAWYSTDNLLINNVAATSSNPVITTTLSVSVNAPITSSTGFFNLRVIARRANLNCAGSLEAIHPIWVGRPGASNATLIYPSGQRGVNPVSLCAGCGYNFMVDFVPGATSYTWTLPPGFAFTNGRNTATPGIRTSSTNGTYTMYCSANNLCGSSWTHNLTINIGSGGPQQRVATGSSVSNSLEDSTAINPKLKVDIFPNPSHSELFVTVELSNPETSGDIEVTLVDSTLKDLFSKETKSRQTVIPTHDLHSGSYILIVNTPEGKVRRHVLIK